MEGVPANGILASHFQECACLRGTTSKKHEKAVMGRGLAGGNRVCCRPEAKARALALSARVDPAGRLERKEKPMPLPRPRGMHPTSIPQRRVLAQYGQYLWPPSVYFVLAEFALANSPASSGRHRFDGLLSLEARTAGPFCGHRKALPSPVKRCPGFSSTLCPVSVQSSVCDTPRSPTRAPLIRPPHPRWWEKTAHDQSRHGRPLHPISPASGVHSVSTA